MAGTPDRPRRIPTVEVRIGVTYSPKELDLELADDADAEGVRSQVEEALSGGESSVLWLTDRRGRQVGVPVGKIAYVEIGPPGADRRIGFAGA
jgi:hypothetical protein